ncbi:hypothetical protein B0A48_11889 [Cryoendolithus antarcticus]|uniref:Thioesterase domain-containing protein n=1 Tax=Cryoendolithus antarcticus TaxID=1507870 RepID=A0A1V8ST14_9PEZI|nr:hypothetical protein B0A48_11889 [Cryoendolithus antarcticus]
MNASKVLRPRVLRPQLSLRYQCLRRHDSTHSPMSPLPTTTTSTASTPLATPKKPSKYSNTRLTWLFLAFGSGLAGAGLAVGYLVPPPLAELGSQEDRQLVADLNKRIDQEFKVKVLRGKCLGVAKQLKGERGGWVEVVAPQVGDEKVGEGKGERGSLIKTLQGSKGLGVERVFWDRGEQRLVAIVWFGGALSGWPSVTHGGLIATMLSEKLALAAALAHGAVADVADAAIPQRLPGFGDHAKMLRPDEAVEEPAQLSLSYVKPTYANAFYVIRVGRSVPLDQDPSHVIPPEPADGRHEFEATLESLDSKTSVTAKAKFKASSRIHQAEGRVENAVAGSYEAFKQWMWPSRQQAMT